MGTTTEGGWNKRKSKGETKKEGKKESEKKKHEEKQQASKRALHSRKTELVHLRLGLAWVLVFDFGVLTLGF